MILRKGFFLNMKCGISARGCYILISQKLICMYVTRARRSPEGRAVPLPRRHPAPRTPHGGCTTPARHTPQLLLSPACNDYTTTSYYNHFPLVSIHCEIGRKGFKVANIRQSREGLAITLVCDQSFLQNTFGNDIKPQEARLQWKKGFRGPLRAV